MKILSLVLVFSLISLLFLVVFKTSLKPSKIPVTSGIRISPISSGLKNLVSTEITFYGWVDNDPPGTSIAYPKSLFPASIHNKTAGIGSFQDPITFATNRYEWPIGTLNYIPYLQKYFLMEDFCEQCSKDWIINDKNHIDLWMESNNEFKQELIDCENQWSRDTESIEINPPPDRPVDVTPFFNPETGECNEY